MRLAVLLLAAAASAQQSTDSDGLLARARARLAHDAAATSKYTCTESVDRSYFRELKPVARSCDAIVANRRSGRSKLSLTKTDRLRFEVEVSDGGHEIYSWPGAARIDTDQIERMAGGGPLGTGPFGPFLLDIFSNPGVRFQFTARNAANLFEYRYAVPLPASHYRVQAGGMWRITGYDGAILLDPASAELKQLTVRTLELPADTGACEATTVMDFVRVQIGAGEYLMPQKTHLGVVARDAGVTGEAVNYFACREFRGESQVNFGEAGEPASAQSETASNARALDLPPALPLVIELETPIDCARAAAGDPIDARAVKPVVDRRSKRILLAGGARLHGRITVLEHHLDPEKYFLIGFAFDGLPAVIDASHPARNARSDNREHAGEAFRFYTPQPNFVLAAGFTSNWVTIGN